MKEIKYAFLLFLILVCSSVALAQNGNNGAVQNRITLASADPASPASGFAEVLFQNRARRALQKFSLNVQQLPANSMFSLTVDGTLINTFSTNSRGKFHIGFLSNTENTRLALP